MLWSFSFSPLCFCLYVIKKEEKEGKEGGGIGKEEETGVDSIAHEHTRKRLKLIPGIFRNPVFQIRLTFFLSQCTVQANSFLIFRGKKAEKLMQEGKARITKSIGDTQNLNSQFKPQT